MATFTPFPPRPGSGGGSYDDTAIKARVEETETVNRTQGTVLDDHGRRILSIEETPPLDLDPLTKRVSDLEAGGVVGPAGPQGPIGPAGADGLRGPAGVQGPAGLDGQPGRDGSNGAPGIQGPVGPVGPEGPIGPAGAQGAQGVQGLPGADGKDGAQGPVGPRGLQGPAGTDAPPYDDSVILTRIGDAETAVDDIEKALESEIDVRAEGDRLLGVRVKTLEDGGGVAGPAGPAGPQGPVGPAGADGARGLQGLPGADGAVGPAGPVGADGVAGPQGPVGPIGPQGPAGTQGERGLQGVQGDRGLQGDRGAQGVQGERGLPGADGAQGAKGDQGIQGAKGDTGPSGQGSPVRTYTKDKRLWASVTGYDLLADAGDATHVRIRLYGGGASGNSPASGGTSQTFAGGEAGEMWESIWFPLTDVDHLTAAIGLGGASNQGSVSNYSGGNPGSATTADLLKGNVVVFSAQAAGGFATFTPYLLFAACLSRFTRGTPLPGQGNRNTLAQSPVKTACDAQTSRNRPTSGGGSNFPSDLTGASDAPKVMPGNGGLLIYDKPEDKHGLKVVQGGAGARSSTSITENGSPGLNPLPDVPGTAGTGGGGACTGNGGDGAAPGGGGGSTSNTSAKSGKGGAGCLDVEYAKRAA